MLRTCASCVELLRGNEKRQDVSQIDLLSSQIGTEVMLSILRQPKHDLIGSSMTSARDDSIVLLHMFAPASACATNQLLHSRDWRARSACAGQGVEECVAAPGGLAQAAVTCATRAAQIGLSRAVGGCARAGGTGWVWGRASGHARRADPFEASSCDPSCTATFAWECVTKLYSRVPGAATVGPDEVCIRRKSSPFQGDLASFQTAMATSSDHLSVSPSNPLQERSFTLLV
eukprot:1169383-Prymnesium_polylepis.1